MKKIILLIIIIISTGCVDYKELNSLSYITGIGIDYIDEEFVVTYEVMDNQKEGAVTTNKTYTVTGTGKTNYEAGVNASNKLNTTSYFAHSQIIIISEEVAKNHLYDISDFVMRNPKLNEEFLLVMTKEKTPEEILNTTSEKYPSASFYICDLIEDNVYGANYYINLPFAVFASKLAEDKMDPAVSIVTLDEDLIVLDGVALFNEYKYIVDGSNEIANVYNSFINENTNIILTGDYENDTVEAITKFENTSIDVKDNIIDISLNVIVEIKKSPKGADLFNNDTYKKLENILTDNLNDKIRNFIVFNQNNNVDLLGLSNLYYIDTRKDNNDLWRSAEVNLNTKLTISRKGLITNVH